MSYSDEIEELEDLKREREELEKRKKIEKAIEEEKETDKGTFQRIVKTSIKKK